MYLTSHRCASPTPFARLDNGRVSNNKYYSSRNNIGRVIVGSTDAQLQFVRQDRQQVLLSKLEQEIEANIEQLAGTDYMLLKGRVRLLTNALLQLSHTYLTLSLTNERSIYSRVHLAMGKGTLHIELLLGDDADSNEDTFATLYCGEEQQWALAGEFRQTLSALKEHMGLPVTAGV